MELQEPWGLLVQQVLTVPTDLTEIQEPLGQQVALALQVQTGLWDLLDQPVDLPAPQAQLALTA